MKPAKRILIIEDDRWLAENYRLVLEKNDWQVASTPFAALAIDIIDDFEPDVILLDFILPGKNAPTLLNELQSHVDTAQLPVVLCSSLPPGQLDAKMLQRYGVQAVIDKTTVTPSGMLGVLDTFFTHATA